MTYLKDGGYEQLNTAEVVEVGVLLPRHGSIRVGGHDVIGVKYGDAIAL